MNYQHAIEAYFNEKQEALITAVKRLCAIRSVKGEPSPGAPFGPGPALCLEQALSLADELGLMTGNYDGYVGVADLNREETAVHILGHLDVVGEGDGWTVTEPYQPLVKDGYIYGRGTADDKGPMAAALLAMAAVKELGVPLRRNARVILGTDEESGSSDIAYYYAREPYAPCTFSPDADFPVINIEKGSYKPIFTKNWPCETVLPRVISFHGGFRINVLPGDAKAQVIGLSPAQVQSAVGVVEGRTGVHFRLEQTGDILTVIAKGVGCHAADPAGGNNAITALLELLCEFPLGDCESTQAVSALHKLFPHGDFSGRALGIAQEDEQSGHLTMVLSLLELGETGVEGHFDSRTPLCATKENCSQIAEAAFARFGFSCIGAMDAPHHTPADSPFVRVLLDCYEAYTGQPGRCLAIGGGTYVHEIPGGVAFGPCMPGAQTNMHGPDEHISIHDLLTAAKIYTQVILELCV